LALALGKHDELVFVHRRRLEVAAMPLEVVLEIRFGRLGQAPLHQGALAHLADQHRADRCIVAIDAFPQRLAIERLLGLPRSHERVGFHRRRSTI
jgi:hypothetical protein